MSDQEPCLICSTTHKAAPHDHLFIHQNCPRCGEFKLTIRTCAIIKKIAAEARVKISGWVSDQNRAGTVPTISVDVLERVSARSLPTFAERADRLLLEAVRGQKKLGDRLNITEPRFVAATYSQDVDEVHFLSRLLEDQDFIDARTMGGDCEVLPHGYIAADALTHRAAPSDKGFVAMWFNEDLTPAYDKGFQVGILGAGYDPVRVDHVEHSNRIDDEIIAHIRTAAFVVADFTGHRGGVYFEAGFALGLGLPVIWTCRTDDMPKLHFDIRQYNTIDWKTPEELATRLQYRLEATVGKGPGTVLNHTDTTQPPGGKN